MTTYKDRLTLAMEAAEIDVTCLAVRLGVSYQAVKKAVDGKTKSFSAQRNDQAALILGVPAAWLATGKGDMFPTTALLAPSHAPGGGQMGEVSVERALGVLTGAVAGLTGIRLTMARAALHQLVDHPEMLDDAAEQIARLVADEATLRGKPPKAA